MNPIKVEVRQSFLEGIVLGVSILFVLWLAIAVYTNGKIVKNIKKYQDTGNYQLYADTRAKDKVLGRFSVGKYNYVVTVNGIIYTHEGNSWKVIGCLGDIREDYCRLSYIKKGKRK